MFQTTTLAKVNISYAVKFIILLTLATGAPLLGFHSQWITGPIVNMALVLSVYILGIRGALLIGLLPSTIALGTGLLPAVLAPMIPFIIIANTLLVFTLDYFANQSTIYNSQPATHNLQPRIYWASLIVASGLKYLFLFSTSSIVAGLLLKQALAAQVAILMSWPQFFTALIGGILAWGILKIVKKD
ncbi:MAG: iron hydrogenase [Candidatus Kuenenbacteria bacterium]